MSILRKYFCFELATAGLVIGWLGLVNSTISGTSMITMLSDPDYYINSTDATDMDPRITKTALVNILATSLALTIINFLASLMLVIGTVKKNHLMIVPWLINSGFALLYGTTMITAITVYMLVNDIEIMNILIFLIFGSIAILFAFYTWTAMYSLYRKFKDQPIIGEQQRLLQKYQTSYSTRA